MATDTRTGGRAATSGVIGGGTAIAVGKPATPTPDGFLWTALVDVARLETGHTPSRRHPEYWDGGIPWIGVRDATANHGRTIYSTNQTVTQTGIDNSSARVLPIGTVCLSRTASVGYVVVMGVPMSTSQDFVNWVCGPSLDNRYLKYILQLERDTLLRFASGTTHQTIYFPEARAFHALLPLLEEQRAISEVLGSLDDKIESNRRLAETCRELIRLEVEARENATWCETPVSGLARFVNGGAYTNGASGTGRMVIRIAELTKGAGGSTVYNDIDAPDDRIARPGDLLMAWSGSLGIHIWLGEEAVINQHIFKVVPDGLPPWLVFDRLERVMPEFRQIAADKATTMGHIKRHHLDDMLVRVPVSQDLTELDTLLGPNWSRALAADIESRILSSLRDLLLPELLSGRLRVPVAEDLVEVTA